MSANNRKQEKATVLNRLETILLSVLSALKVSVTDYCDLETVDGHHNIVFNNGSLMTLIAYDGTRTIVSDSVFYDHLTRLEQTLDVFLSKSGHQFGMVFRRDLDPTSDVFKIAELKKATARSLELNLDFLIDEEVEVYSKFVYDETNYMVLITHPKLLESAEVALEAKRKGLLYKEHDIPSFMDSQNIMLVNSYLKSQHETYVESVLSVLEDNRFAAQAHKMDVVTALRAIKKSVSPQTTDDNWIPQIPNTASKVSMRWKTNYQPKDVSHLLWQPLPEQIMRNTINGVDRASSGTYPTSAVLTENRIYAPLMIAVPPQSASNFNQLFAGLNNASTRLPSGEERSLPYAISFMLSGDGFAGYGLKKSLAKILAVASSDNAAIKSAIDSLSNYADNRGTVVGLSISCMTWAENNAYGIDEIQIRRSKLWRTLEAWGGCQVAEKGGDPILGFTSNLPGVTYKHHAPRCAAPLWEALHLMPWCRQASPFKLGTIMNRSVDGKLMKQEPFSGELTTWIKLYIGKPGSGKSVAMNNDIIESCLMPDLKRLPLIFMVDVGVSSRGPIELLQDHLPKEKRHLAVYKRLKNDTRFSMNPLDCSVGRMSPTPNETAQMVSFFSTLITPIEADGKAEKGLSNFLTQIIHQTFIYKMDNDERGHPNMYEPNVNYELDELLADNNIDAYGLSYYELVNRTHVLKLYRARDLCHRLAMPVLADTIAVATSNPEIKSSYENTRTSSGETVIDMFTRGVTEASAMYPVFCEYTKFDVDVARVVSLDLQDVIGQNHKQSSLFFQIARIFAKKKTAYTEDDIATFPPAFRAYYTRLIEEVSEDRKILAYDELHNAKRDEGLFAELERDCREARKWGMELKFASQMLEDFGRIPQLATQFVIADRGTPKSREYMREQISLLPVEEVVLANHVRLGFGGLTYLSKIVAKNGTYVSLMTLTLGPQKLWALTTDSDDRLLRGTMYELLGDRPLALRLLAKAFPNGARQSISARKEQGRTLNQGLSDEIINKEDEMDSIIRVIAKEVIDRSEYYIGTKILL